LPGPERIPVKVLEKIGGFFPNNKWDILMRP